MSVDGRVDTEEVVHGYNGILLSHERGVDGPGGYCAEYIRQRRTGAV